MTHQFAQETGVGPFGLDRPRPPEHIEAVHLPQLRVALPLPPPAPDAGTLEHDARQHAVSHGAQRILVASPLGFGLRRLHRFLDRQRAQEPPQPVEARGGRHVFLARINLERAAVYVLLFPAGLEQYFRTRPISP